MSVKIDDTRIVSNFCLARWLFEVLPSGTYYLTLSAQWNGGREEKPQILLVREDEGRKLSGMTIEDPTSMEGLRIFAECHGFKAADDTGTVFVRRK